MNSTDTNFKSLKLAQLSGTIKYTYAGPYTRRGECLGVNPPPKGLKLIQFPGGKSSQPLYPPPSYQELYYKHTSEQENNM